MEAIFGKSKTPAERIKEYNRSIKKRVPKREPFAAKVTALPASVRQYVRRPRRCSGGIVAAAAPVPMRLGAGAGPGLLERGPGLLHHPSVAPPRSVREIDRERMQLERQEKKLITDIKKSAKDGQMDSAKVMAKDLVRTRGYIKKM